MATHRSHRRAAGPQPAERSRWALLAICLGAMVWSGPSTAWAAQPSTVTVYHLKGGSKIAGWRVGSSSGRTQIKQEDGTRVWIKEADIVKTETRKAKPVAKAEKASTPKSKLKQRVNLNFASTPLRDVATALKDKTGMKVVVPPGFGEKRIKLNAKNQTLKEALNQIARQTACKWKETRGRIYFVDPKAARESMMAGLAGEDMTMSSPVFNENVTIDCQETPLSDVAVVLQESTNARIVVYPRLRNTPITLKWEDRPLRDFLEVLAAIAGAKVTSRGAIAYLK